MSNHKLSLCTAILVGLTVSAVQAVGQEIKIPAKKQDDKKIVVKVEKASQDLLPLTTRMWLSVPDATKLSSAFYDTRYGELVNNETLQPFVEKVTNQLKGWLDKKNVELGIKVDDLGEVHTGEICMAAVLPDGEDKSDYGFVMMIDVSDTQVEAEDLLKDLSVELKKREATPEEMKLNGIKTIKWTYPKPKGLAKQKFAYHAMTERWLIVCDNEKLTNEIISRVSADSDSTTKSLADSETFQKIQLESKLVGVDTPPHIKFYVEPFGYYDIIADIAKQHEGVGDRSNNYANILRDTGFRAIKGVGGNIVLGGEDAEVLFRMYTYAPPNSKVKGRKYEGAAEILDVSNKKGHDLKPEPFVAENSSGYMTMSLDMLKVFNNIKPVVDGLINEGTFDGAVASIRDDDRGPKVNLEDLIKKLDDRVSVFTENIPPVDESSEKIVIGVKVKDADIDWVFEKVQRIIKNVDVIDFEGTKIFIDDTNKEVEDDPLWSDLDKIDDEGDEDEEEQPKPLFEKRVYVIAQDYILVGNDLDYVKRVIKNQKGKPGMKLQKSADFVRVNEYLGRFVDNKRVGLRQFIRLDESIRVNYEMLRQGKMATSNTVLAKLLNQALTPKDMPEDQPRDQKIDGSDLPKDFEKKIAPYFGPGGWALETENTGWILTGVILPKAGQPKVASKQKEGSQRQE